MKPLKSPRRFTVDVAKDDSTLVGLINTYGFAIINGIERLKYEPPKGSLAAAYLNEKKELEAFAERFGSPTLYHTTEDTDRLLHTHDVQSLILVYCVRQSAIGGESLLLDGQAFYQNLQQSEHSGLVLTLTSQEGTWKGGMQFVPLSSKRVRFIYGDINGGKIGKYTRARKYLTRAVDECTRYVKLKAGQGLLVDNFRMAHGRLAAKGPRNVHDIDIDCNRDASKYKGIEPGIRI